jgi:integrase/recombinase XerD
MQKSVTMHVFRHSAAMRLLHAGIDTSVIALWLGHENVETTQVYLHAGASSPSASRMVTSARIRPRQASGQPRLSRFPVRAAQICGLH